MEYSEILKKHNITTSSGSVPVSKNPATGIFEKHGVVYKPNKIGNNIYNRINTWINNHNAFVSDYQNRFSGRKYNYEDAYVGDSASYLDKVNKQSAEYKQEYNDIIAHLDKNGKYLDSNWVKEVKEFLTKNDAVSVYDQIVEGATKDNDYWNTFAPNEEQSTAGYTAEKIYNEWQSEQKQTTNDMAYDIAAGKLELEGLKKEKAAYLEEQAKKREEKEKNKSWWEKLAGYIGEIQDTTLPLAGVNQAAGSTYYNPYDKLIAEKEQQIARATYVQGYAGYMDNINATDYVTDSQYVSTRTNVPLEDAAYTVSFGVDGEGTPAMSTMYSTSNLFGDFLYDYINKNEDALTVASANDTSDYSYFLGHDKGFLQTMTDEEIGVFNYLYKTKSPEAANEFLTFIESDLQGRRRLQEQAKWAAYAKESPVGSSVFSTLISPLKGISYVSQAADMLDDGKMQADAGYNRFSYIPSTIRSTVSSKIENSGKWGKVGSFAYNTGMSMADFVSTTAVSGGNQALSLAIMGTGAAADATLSAKDRGLDDGQAFALGTIAGLAEVAMEKFSLGAWLEGDMTEGALRYVLKNALSEGREEAGTSAINLLADIMIAGDKSEWYMAMQEYMDAGKTEAEAFGLVAAEQAAQIGLDALGGILSGSAIGGGTYAGTSTAASFQYGDIGKDKAQKLVAEGLELNPTSKYVQKAQSKVEKGKSLSGMQVRNILAANQEKITANDMKKIQQAAEKRLADLGQTENVSEVAEIATKWATGQEITRAEKRVLTHSQYGSRVANELLPENIASEDYSTDWAEEIGTESVNKTAYNKKAIQTLIDAMASAEDSAAYKSLVERAGTESTFNVAKSGQATVRDEAIDLRKAEVVDFVKDKKGNIVDMTVKVDGKEVKASEIDYADGDQSYLFEAVSKIENITPADATVIVRDYDASSGQSVGEYLNGIDEGYTYGYYGYSEADLKAGNFAPKLTETQMKTAYELGKFARKNSVDANDAAKKRMRTAAEAAMSQTEKAEQQKARIASNDAEVYFQDGKSVVKFDENTGKYDNKRMAAVNTAKFLSKLGIGGKYYFYESYMKDGIRVYKDANGNEVEAPNGIYKEADGSIHIDLNAGNAGQGTALFTLGHELTHFVKDQSKKQFKILGDLVTAAFDKTDISMHERVLEKQKFLESKRGEKVSYDEAFEEVVADATSTMLSDGSFYDLIMEIRVKDKGLFATIKQFFDKMIAKFKKVYEQLTPDQRDARDIWEMKDAFDHIQKAFAEALVEASDNFQATHNNPSGEAMAVKDPADNREDGTLHSDRHTAKYADRGFNEHSVKTALYDAFDHSDHGDDNLIRVSSMPKYIVNKLGIDGDFYIYRDHAYENMVSEEQAVADGRPTYRRGQKVHFHNHGIEKMTRAILSLNDPTMTIATKTKHGNPAVIMLLPEFGQNKAPLYAVLSFYSNAPINGSMEKKPHIVLTIAERNFFEDGGRTGLSDIVKSAIDEGRVIDFNKKRRDDLSVIANPAGVGNITDASLTKNLSHFRNEVNAFRAKHNIKYSERGEDTSNRKLLANAFEGISQNSVEYAKLQEYRDNIKVLNLLEDQLAELNAQIREIRFTKGKYDAKKLRALEEKAGRIAKDINKQDKVLLNMEASGPLRKVIEFERKKAAQKTKEHIKEIQENKKARAEQTELRHKIRRAVRELNKLLNRGNKKTNVKEDMKGFVSKALELADYLFTDHISNDELIRKGITVRMTEKEVALAKETEEILSQLYDHANSLTDEEFTKLDAKRKANEDKLRDLLTAQRNERLNTPVYNLFNDLVTEYASLKNSKQEAVKGAYDPKVEEFLRSYIGETNGETDSDRKTLLQNMRVADMTTEELWKLHNAYTMALHSVRNANKLFVAGKSESLETMANNIVADFSKRNAPNGKVATVLRNLSNKMGWDYEKLYYALDRIGSEAFTELVMNIANSENIVMQDVIEAAAFRDKIVEKYGFNDWMVNQKIDREFLDNTGKKFQLTLGELMSLYAYSRREGAWDHIEYGGFVFGKAALTDPKPADSYKLTREQCEAITNTLTQKQKGYVERMQKYLSETMGEKGNEVSLLLYGIKMFGEKNYFPIHIAGQFKAQANESQAKAAAGFSTMTNAGFTHAQNPNAKAPFVLEGFNEVWADHVNEMSRYHGTVPALEDMRRVMNRSSYSEADSESVAIKQLMENSFGKEAVEYFDNLYREANSGAVSDKLQRVLKKSLSLFRKNSVAYSLSVIIQQPSAMVRAYAMIDKKYFGYNHRGPFKTTAALSSGIAKAVSSKWNPAYANAYNEMLKYAPGVTMSKEIGGFDTHTGSSIREYLLDTGKNFKQSMKTENIKGKGKALLDLVDDNAIANLPNAADKIAWIEIWNACKREIMSKRGQEFFADGGVLYAKQSVSDRKKQYVSSNVNLDILNLIDRVQQGKFAANEKVQLVPVSDEIAMRIHKLTGVDVRGYKVAIEARQIEHILKDHGENGGTDHTMADATDIARMEFALEDPDSIVDAGTTRAYVTIKNGKMKPAKTVLYEKQNGDGSYYVVQAVPDTNKKTLYIVTAFMGKEGYKKTEAPQSTNANSPGVTPKAESAKASNIILLNGMGFVNSENAEAEAFLQAVGARFTEVIRATQVYDSIFAKSPMLKSKSVAVQYLVSFMNEPNTTANMVEKAVRDAIKGNWKGGLRIAAAVTSSIIFNNVLKGIIYAMRDDDEDETYIEKYLAAVAGGIMDDFNPVSYIPVARDVWSKVKGFDVERPDVAIISDAIDAYKAVVKYKGKETEGMTDEEIAALDKNITDASWKLVGSLVAFFGIPVKNIYREIDGVIDQAKIASANAGMTTASSIWDKVKEEIADSIPFVSAKETKSDKLYEAIISGDKTYLDRLKGTYTDDDAYHSAVRKALRENDPRIHEAAQARVDGNTEEYKRIFREIKGEGKFSFDDIMGAVNSELSAIEKKLEPEKVSSQYSAGDFVEAVAMGNTTEAQAVRDDIIAAKVANGKTREEAEKEFASNVGTDIGKAYSSGLLDSAQAEKLLVEYAGKDEGEAASKVNYWAFCEEHREYKDVLTESNVNDYQEFAEPAKISLDVFAQFVAGTKGIETIKDEWGDVEVSKRDQVLEVIDSLSITRKQKDALYLAAGYSENNIWDVPW